MGHVNRRLYDFLLIVHVCFLPKYFPNAIWLIARGPHAVKPLDLSGTTFYPCPFNTEHQLLLALISSGPDL